MAFMSVDLPAPLAPMRPTISPLWTLRDTLSTATRPPKRTLRPLTASTGPDAAASTSAPRCLRTTSAALGRSATGRSPTLLSAQDKIASRSPEVSWLRPRGKYNKTIRSPRLELSSPTRALLGASAGIPITTTAPMMAPETDPMPPITTMATRLRESFTKKKSWVKAMLA